MKVWNKYHRYIFNQYRDVIKCVLEHIDERLIVRQLTQFGMIYKDYVCEICEISVLDSDIDFTFGNKYLEMRNYGDEPEVYYEIPCSGAPAYAYTHIDIYSSTPILARICVFRANGTLFIFNLKKRREGYPLSMDGWRLEEL